MSNPNWNENSAAVAEALSRATAVTADDGDGWETTAAVLAWEVERLRSAARADLDPSGHSLVRRCFFCSSEQITNVCEVRLPHPDDPDWWAMATGEVPWIDHGLVVTAAACAAHYDALADALSDHVGSASGWWLPVDPPCPHPFHSREDEHPPEETVTEHLGGGLWSESYKCPECGFATMQHKEHVAVDDPAYVFALAVLRGSVVKLIGSVD